METSASFEARSAPSSYPTKETIDVSIAEGQREGEVRHYGVIASDLEPLDKVVRALRAPDRRLHFVYEAGPCGFGIYRHLTN